MEIQNHIKESFTNSLTWRSLTIEDAPAISRLYQDCARADNTFWGGSLQEVLEDFAEPGFCPQTDSLAGFLPGGEIASLGWLFPVRISPEMQFAFLWGMTTPQYRRQGLGSVVMGWLKNRGEEALKQTGSSAPAFLRGIVPDGVPGAAALYQQAGLTHVRSTYRMRRDFAIPIEESHLHHGLRMASWNEGNLKDIHIALNEAFQDHWGHVDQTYEQFLAGTQGSATFAPDLSFLVMDGDIIAGVSLNRVLYYENERTGIQEGWIGSLGVRRAWRNQGIASALLNASMLAFQKSELSYAGLSVDTENLTGALRLYEKQGFAPVNISYTYMKQINLHK